MYRRRLLALALAALPALACNSTNPVEPAPSAGSGSGSATVVVTLTSDQSQLPAGSTQGANLTVTARTSAGAPVANGTTVAVSTNLGNFGVDSTGKPIQLVQRTLAGGSASVVFFAGADMGTANIVAQVGTNSGKLNLPIVSPSAPPVANFTFAVSNLSVLFTDTSTGNPTAWDWDFGDGTTKTRQNPAHTYAAAGTYTVSLTITAPGGQSNKRQFVTVAAGDPLIADFGYAVNGLTVLFADASSGTPTSWAWTFGDGKTSTLRNPSHTYARAGTYTVTLSVVNAFGATDSTSQFVSLSLGAAPVADFQAQTNGLQVLFTDMSTGNPTAWTWDFGDGGTSSQQSPQHTYAQAGTFNVTLTASNSAGSSSKSKFVTVSLGTAPQAAFSFQANNLTVLFVDSSTGNPTSWSWDFGDGATSTQQNPTHTYAKAGTYTVVLTAANAAGSSHTSQLVTVSSPPPPPVATFCYQRNGLAVLFLDISSGSPTAWEWNFGDCSGSTTGACQSTAQNPGHTYTAAGTYAVTLTVFNKTGQSTQSRFVTVDATTMDSSPICF
jgi:PKD repeat protein